MTFAIRQLRGSAGELHGRAVPDDVLAEVWWLEATHAAVALGSRQTPEVLSTEAVARTGLEVVRRRSGGGAVLIVPGEMVWIDVIVPTGHRLWRADVGRSMEVIGAAWLRALAPLSSRALRVHEGAMVRSAWSDLVCFDGIGPGEVFAGDAKLVGISQRRTRAAARFQCALHLQHDPEALVNLLAGQLPSERRRPVATLPGAVAADVSMRLAAALDLEHFSG